MLLAGVSKQRNGGLSIALNVFHVDLQIDRVLARRKAPRPVSHYPLGRQVGRRRRGHYARGPCEEP